MYVECVKGISFITYTRTPVNRQRISTLQYYVCMLKKKKNNHTRRWVLFKEAVIYE